MACDQSEATQDVEILSPAQLVSEFDANICAPMVRYRFAFSLFFVLENLTTQMKTQQIAIPTPGGSVQHAHHNHTHDPQQRVLQKSDCS